MENGEGPSINCNNCDAACCRAGNRYQLGSNEAQSMGLNENNIVIHSMDLMDSRPDTYETPEDCINLIFDEEPEPNTPEFKCSLHGTERKPFCCSYVKPGSSYCLHARKMRGYNDVPNQDPLPVADFSTGD